MLDRRDECLRAVDGEWHAFRERARETAFSENEFDEIDQERYDLDTAGIDGRDHVNAFPNEDERDKGRRGPIR